jgi:hypothetical protein
LPNRVTSLMLIHKIGLLGTFVLVTQITPQEACSLLLTLQQIQDESGMARLDYLMGASGLAVAGTVHHLQGEPGRDRGWPPAHLDANFYRLHDLLRRSPGLVGLFDVPLRA